MNTKRYAIYYAPEEGREFERLGATWIGRDAVTGSEVAQPAVDGFEPERFREITAFPRHYGFHGTLKAPIRLAEGVGERDFHAAVAEFAASRRSFILPPLQPAWMNRFLALRPAEPCPELEDLASASVRELDHFREAPSAEELEKRRAKCVNARQVELLEQWGYPYVMEEFRFHMTLTGPMADPNERIRLRSAAESLWLPVCAVPRPVWEICVFQQENENEPFLIARRFPFGVSE